MIVYIRQLRPKHWLKNIFLFVPLVFSLELMEQNKLLKCILAFAAFCSISSSVYTFNDICDRDKDAMHPLKCNRPIASGAISKQKAIILCIVLLLYGGILSLAINKITFLYIYIYIFAY